MDMVKKRLPVRDPDGHKGTFGTLSCVCGSLGMSGAAVMSIMSAIKCGVGVVRAVLPMCIYNITAARAIEATFLPLKENQSGTIAAWELPRIMDCMESCSAAMVGCGMGWNKDTELLIYNIIKNSKIPLIIDADGINAISQNINILDSVRLGLIITPHMGEMSRLLKVNIDKIEADREKYITDLATRYKIVVVLKGRNTLISDPNGHLFINMNGNDGMAKGGSGDVLSGMIGSFLAQGLSPIDAAICGVHIHAEAGDRCRAALSKTAMLPTDIINELPRLFLEIEK